MEGGLRNGGKQIKESLLGVISPSYSTMEEEEEGEMELGEGG